MSADNVTPIRPPGSEPPTEVQDTPETPEDVLQERLRHVRALVDLIHFAEHESLYDDTMNNALWVVDRYISEAQEAAERLCRRSREA